MTVFVTGGTGFIGREVVRRLFARGHREVRCLVRPTSDPAAVSFLQKLGARPVQGDLSDRASLAEAMKGCPVVINVGAAYSFWTSDRESYRSANVEGVRNVMECCLETGASKVVHVSTVAVYGRPSPGAMTEDTAPGPVRFSDYAETKYAGELVAWDLHRSKELPLVMVYPGGVLGPGDPKASGQYIRDLVNRRLPATVFDDSPFPWVHVRDVAEGIVKAVEKEGNIGQKYFLVAENLTFGQINQAVSEIASVRLPRLHLPDAMAMASAAALTALSKLTKKPPMLGMSLDQMRTMKNGLLADGSKAARELGLVYTPVRNALAEAIASYRL